MSLFGGIVFFTFCFQFVAGNCIMCFAEVEMIILTFPLSLLSNYCPHYCFFNLFIYSFLVKLICILFFFICSIIYLFLVSFYLFLTSFFMSFSYLLIFLFISGDSLHIAFLYSFIHSFTFGEVLLIYLFTYGMLSY